MDKEKIEKAVKMILEAVGEDPNREGLLETPQRIARMYEEIFYGIGRDASEHLSKTFTIENSDIVVEKDIPFYSMCEHHLLPFYGKVHLAYLPVNKVAGLSKLVRTVDLYSRKPQLQERLTEEIANALKDFLDCEGSLVVVEAEHLCMNMRGIKRPGAKTVTMHMTGKFLEDEKNQTRRIKTYGNLNVRYRFKKY